MQKHNREPIRLSDHFTYGKLIRFVIPSVCMMIFTSIYSVVDGFFVSNFVGKTPFAAVNLIMPLLMIFGAVGFMMGAGGNAIVGKTLGEGDVPRANRYFSLFIYVTGAVGALFALIGIVFMRPLAGMLGAEGEILSYCVVYGRIILCALPFFMLQNMFGAFFITAEKPQLGLYMTVLSGVLNMVLDAVLVAGVFQMLQGIPNVASPPIGVVDIKPLGGIFAGIYQRILAYILVKWFLIVFMHGSTLRRKPIVTVCGIQICLAFLTENLCIVIPDR